MPPNAEPVAVINVLVGLVEAALVVAVAFGLNLSAEQVAAISGLIMALGAVATTLWARSQVTPVSFPRDGQGHSLAPVDNQGNLI